MATRLDRVTSNSSRVDRERDLAARARDRRRAEEARRQAEAPASAAATVAAPPRELPPGVLGSAMATWLVLTFALCHVALPAVLRITGIAPEIVNSVVFDLPAFALTSLVAIVGVLLERPRIDLSPMSKAPVGAAMLGGLAVFAVVHNVAPGLVHPFSSMSTAQLASVVGLSVLEIGLVGAMLGSLTKRADVALALGGGFYLGFYGLLLTAIGLWMSFVG